MKPHALKRKMSAIIILLFIAQGVYGQIQIDHIKTKIACNFPPLQPLPIDKTYNIEYPSLQYAGLMDVLFSGSSFFDLPHKREEKKPADYTFKFDLSTIKFISIQPLEKPSTKTVTEKEFVRIYTFICPAKLIIIDNSTHQAIKTITVVTADEQFTKNYHRNFFAKFGQPGYNTELGFETLQQLYERKDEDRAILTKLEQEFAADTFDKMKEILMHLYGNKRFNVRLAILNPEKKKRKHNFSDFDSTALTLKAALDTLEKYPSNSSYPPLLDNAEQFYTQVQNQPEKFEDFIPVMVYWNLALIQLFKNDLSGADAYMNKLKNANQPKYALYYALNEDFERAKRFFASRNKLKTLDSH